MERICLCFDLRAMRGASVAIRSRPRRPLARSLRVRPMRNMVQGETPPPVFRKGGNGPLNCAGRQVATVHRLELDSRGRPNDHSNALFGSFDRRTDQNIVPDEKNCGDWKRVAWGKNVAGM